jgi:WD40 repeat protein
MFGLTPQVNASSSVYQARDLELPQYPTDTVSAVRWSPTSNLLSATSWDKSVRIWEVSEQGNVALKFGKDTDSPITSMLPALNVQS